MIATTAGAALAPLSSRQRQKLAGLAALAFEKVDGVGDFNVWRHREVERVVHRGGLRECLNMHYLPLLAHFNELLGRSDRAVRALVKAETEPRSWALHALHREAKAVEDVLPRALDYARGFLKNMRGVTLDEASDRDIWHAVFTIRRKAQTERKKKRGGETVADVLARVLPAKRVARRDDSEDPF